MNLNVDELVMLLGQKEVELYALKKENGLLNERLAKLAPQVIEAHKSEMLAAAKRELAK